VSDYWPIGTPGPEPEQQEPRDHILRELLPWRSEQLTECGRKAADVASTITREQLVWRVKKYGKQRTAFMVCMTCYQTANDAATWETQPGGVLSREMRRHPGGIVYYDQQRNPETHGYIRTGPHVDTLDAELHAIAQLIEAHRDEFDQRVASATEAALFAHRRRVADRERKQK
jgi:hypothetical protein